MKNIPAGGLKISLIDMQYARSLYMLHGLLRLVYSFLFFSLNQWHYFVRTFSFNSIVSFHFHFRRHQSTHPHLQLCWMRVPTLHILALTMSIVSVMRTRSHDVVVNTLKNVTNFFITTNIWVCDGTPIILIHMWIEKKRELVESNLFAKCSHNGRIERVEE